MTFYAETLWRDRDRAISNFVRERDAPFGLTSVDPAAAISELHEESMLRSAPRRRWQPITDDGRAFPLFVLVTSAIVMGTVLLSQYWGGLAPCELCLTERWPWDAAIVIAFVAAMVGSRPALPWVALLLAAVFVAGGALAFYHVGVERHWFAGPSACTAGGTPATLEALKAQLMRAQPVQCDEPAWMLFGVSLAGFNLLASLVMAAICIIVFSSRYKARRRLSLRGLM